MTSWTHRSEIVVFFLVLTFVLVHLELIKRDNIFFFREKDGDFT